MLAYGCLHAEAVLGRSAVYWVLQSRITINDFDGNSENALCGIAVVWALSRIHILSCSLCSWPLSLLWLAVA